MSVGRCVALLCAAAALAGCGGNAAEPAQAPVSTPGSPAATNDTKPTAQEAARKLLAELDPRGCGCTAETRAHDRVASGKVKVHPDGYTLTP